MLEMNSDVIRVAVDDGYADTNLVAYSDVGQILAEITIPSRARSGLHGTTTVGNKKAVVHCSYETDDLQFTVGDFRDAEATRFDDYPYSGMNRSIIHHALRLAGFGGRPISLATGLPLSDFYVDGRRNVDAINKKIESLNKRITATDGSKMAEIMSHRVFPEGLSAYIDYMVDGSGKVTGDSSMTIGIIDVGGKTTDMAVVLPGSQLDHARSGSENIGVLDLVENLKSEINREFKVQVPSTLVMSSLKNKKLKLWGEDKDISKLIEGSSAVVLDRILREVNRRFGSAVDLDRILLVGGGANIFTQSANFYPNIVIPERPEYANARGFAKFLLVG